MVALLAVLLIAVGCGNAEEENQNLFNSSDVGLDGDGDEDVSDGDGDVGDEEPGDDEPGDGDEEPGDDEPGDDEPGDDEPPGDEEVEDPFLPGPICVSSGFGTAYDGAELVYDEVIWREMNEFPYTSGCDFDGTALKDVIMFQLYDLSEIHATAGPGVGFELRRRGSCPGLDSLGCGVEELVVENLPWNQNLFLFIYQLDDELEADDVVVNVAVKSPEQCEEPGVTHRCGPDGGVEYCTVTELSPDVERWVWSPCPTECVDGYCEGDRCSNPLEVSDSTFLNVPIAAFSSGHDNADDMSCVEAGGEVNTPERDLIILLKDLEAEQEVEIEVGSATPPGFRIMVKENCSDDAMCTAAWTGETSVVFEAPAAGDYFLILDSSEMLLEEDELEVTIDFL